MDVENAMEHLGGSHVTYVTKCWTCGTQVFFHTNGYGDVVLFDSLGWPWLVHFCYHTRHGAGPSPGYRPYMVAKYGRLPLSRTSNVRAAPSAPPTRPPIRRAPAR